MELKIPFQTENTIEKLLYVQHGINTTKLNKCGIYQLSCPDCIMKYVGQTD